MACAHRAGKPPSFIWNSKNEARYIKSNVSDRNLFENYIYYKLSLLEKQEKFHRNI
jgi:hypothetical protein